MTVTETSPTKDQPAVSGTNTAEGDGLWGQSDAGRGVVGVSKDGTGVWGDTATGRAVVGVNREEGTGVWGETKKGRGVVGISDDGVGVWGKGPTAGVFEGDVNVTGALTLDNHNVINL